MSTLSFLNNFVMYSELRYKSHAPVFSFYGHTTDGYLDEKKFQHKTKLKGDIQLYIFILKTLKKLLK